MLFMGTILTFVVLTLYAFVYTNYRRRIRRYMAVELSVPGCYYYETDSDDSDEELVVTKVEAEGPEDVDTKKKESILSRL